MTCPAQAACSLFGWPSFPLVGGIPGSSPGRSGMPYRWSSREEARTRLLRIQEEISEILGVFPELAELTHRRRRSREAMPESHADKPQARPHGIRPHNLRTLH